jgi:peptide/nickel transport system substrate-binding protein
MRVTYFALPDEPWAAGAGRYVVGVLNDLGYRARLRVLPYGPWTRQTNDSRKRSQIGTGGWVADYPVASNFLDYVLRCSRPVPPDPDSTSNSAQFCHPEIDRQMDLANRLQFVDPIRANELWAEIDRRVVDLAPWVPLVTSRWVDFTSDRVGNFQYNPVLGILTDQLWVQ